MHQVKFPQIQIDWIVKIAAVVLFISFLSLTNNAHAKQDYYSHTLCKQKELFRCIKVKRGDTWKKLWPDEQERDLVKRLNRMNVRLTRGMKLAVPDEIANLDLRDLSPYPSSIEATGKKTIVFQPYLHAWGAYDEKGNLLRWGPASGGKAWCPDIKNTCRTVSGEFRMYTKRDETCFSSKFPIPGGGAPMPHCMFFHGGYAFHGSNTVPGYHDSHGCIRVFKKDAKWLNEEFIELPSRSNRHRGTTVIITPYGDEI